MTLNSSTRAPKFLSRVCAAALIVGGLSLTVPTTYASEHPEPDVNVKKKEKSVMKWTTDTDGDYKTYVIVKEDGKTEAYELDSEGNKTFVDPDEINIKMIDLPKPPQPPNLPKSKRMSEVFADFDREDGGQVMVFDDWSDFSDFAKLGDMQSLKAIKNMKSLEKLGELRGMIDEEKIEAWAEEFGEEMGVWGERFGEDVEVFALNMAEQFKAGNMRFKIMIDDEDGAWARYPKRFEFQKSKEIDGAHIEKRLRSTREMLKDTERMLESDGDREETRADLKKARKELEKARKALAAAEKAMREAE